MTGKLYHFRGRYISRRMMASIRNYIEMRIMPGAFLKAVICNNLSDACFNADDENLDNLLAFVGYFYNEAPNKCWGSRAAMLNWIKEVPKNA